MKQKFQISLSDILLVIGATIIFILFILRFNQVFHFDTPWMISTSGYEEESLYALYKYLYGLPVYQDPHQLPFAASYFNWLFYHIYGNFISLLVPTLKLQDQWIPTLGRLLTVGITLLGCALTTRLLQKLSSQQPLNFLTAFCLSLYLWFGPLIGYWSMTVRPDLLALLFELMAAYAIITYLPKWPVRAVIVAAIGCYASWSCKQINVVMPLSIGLFLLWQRQLKLALILSTVFFALLAITMLLASEAMIQNVFFIGTAIPLSFDTFYLNIWHFVKKTIPLLCLGMVYFVALWRYPALRITALNHPAFRFATCGIIAWCLILLPASAKEGSAENYYFTLSLYLTLWVGAMLSFNPPQWTKKGFGAAGLLATFSVAWGLHSSPLISIQAQHAQHERLYQCMLNAPQPILVLNHYAALPWMNPSQHSFVLAYNYWRDRSQGVLFENNGIGGLIANGYFNTLVIPKEIGETLDTANLENYQRISELCGNYAILLKKGEHACNEF